MAAAKRAVTAARRRVRIRGGGRLGRATIRNDYTRLPEPGTNLLTLFARPGPAARVGRRRRRRARRRRARSWRGSLVSRLGSGRGGAGLGPGLGTGRRRAWLGPGSLVSRLAARRRARLPGPRVAGIPRAVLVAGARGGARFAAARCAGLGERPEDAPHDVALGVLGTRPAAVGRPVAAGGPGLGRPGLD